MASRGWHRRQKASEMPLRLTLKPDERVIVNGCILKNGPRRHVLEVENRADVLRGDEMLDAESATTPARRVAYQIQIGLVSPGHRAALLPQIEAALRDLAHALPRQAAVIDRAEAALAEANYYAAFRALTPVFSLEDQLLGAVNEVAP